jgi:hypothetical protein
LDQTRPGHSCEQALAGEGPEDLDNGMTSNVTSKEPIATPMKNNLCTLQFNPARPAYRPGADRGPTLGTRTPGLWFAILASLILLLSVGLAQANTVTVINNLDNRLEENGHILTYNIS